MLLVNRITKAARHTLFIAVGAQQINCGVLQSTKSKSHWIKDSLLGIPIDAENEAELPITTLVNAVHSIQPSSAWSSINEVRVLIADYWLAVAGIPWSASIRRMTSADTYARTQLVDMGFEIAPNDLIKLDDAPFGAPRLAVAYPAALVTSLNHLAISLNARFTSFLPYSAAAWALTKYRNCAKPQALAILDTGMMAFARGAVEDSSRLSDITVRINGSNQTPGIQDLNKAWQRVCLRDPQSADAESAALLDLTHPDEKGHPAEKPFVRIHIPPQGECSNASPSLDLAANMRSTHHALDAMSGTSFISSMRWLTLGVTALLVGALIIHALHTNYAIRSFTSHLNAVTRAAQPTIRTTSWNRDELSQIQAVNSAIRELNLPISSILRALEPPADIRVAVLSVETTGSVTSNQAASIKIVAESHTGADMARYVAFVAERKPFTGAYLTRHEIDKTSAEHPYRFTVEALWRE